MRGHVIYTRTGWGDATQVNRLQLGTSGARYLPYSSLSLVDVSSDHGLHVSPNNSIGGRAPRGALDTTRIPPSQQYTSVAVLAYANFQSPRTLAKLPTPR